MFLPIICFGLLFWLGLYISHRDHQHVQLRLTGVSLILTAVGIGASIILSYEDFGTPFVSDFIQFLPNICFYLSFGAWVTVLLASKFVRPNKQEYSALSWQGLSFSERIILLMPLVSFSLIILLNKLNILVWDSGKLIIYGITLSLFGIQQLIIEIKAQGEAWLPDFFRSLDYALFFTLFVSGQVALVVFLGVGWNGRMVLLLLLSIMLSIFLQINIFSVRSLLDNIAFATFPKLREKRSRLRLLEKVQVRVDSDAEPEQLTEEELYKHTRRALSYFGDLQKLAACPLTQLKLIDKRLQERNAQDELLERANELKSVFLECIMLLKPQQEKEFDTTSEWRYYNSLYFPYIIGIKPYSSKYYPDNLDASALEAYDWFRTHVPERTYYNWQNAGAKLVALMLKEKNQA